MKNALGSPARMDLRFDKYQGTGNDFIVCRLPDAARLTTEQAVALCDRHYGVGADGVLVISDATIPEAQARMTVLNADGSRPEMCGNGLRCVALHLTREKGARELGFAVQTDAGLRQCLVQMGGASNEGWVTTGLGRGVEEGSHQADWHGETLNFARVSMGNPHAICFHEPLIPAQLDLLGPAVSAQFPDGSNVEIASVEGPQRLRLDVWERGVGRTLACGTGAAATVVAAARTGLVQFGAPVAVRLPGGPLEITVTETLEVTLRGPAVWVFSGSVQLPAK